MSPESSSSIEENLALSHQIGVRLQGLLDEHLGFNNGLIELEKKLLLPKDSQWVLDIRTIFSDLHTKLHRHFREEEHQLFSLMQYLPTSLIPPEILESLVHQIVNEHAMISRLVSHIDTLLVHGSEEWLKMSLESFISYLRIHGRKEHTTISHLMQILHGEPQTTYADSDEIAQES